jgi:hypothetical protein
MFTNPLLCTLQMENGKWKINISAGTIEFDAEGGACGGGGGGTEDSYAAVVIGVDDAS